MTNLTKVPEYGWEDTSVTCAHAYLYNSIKKALNFAIKEDAKINNNIKVKIFDAGCGNGYIAKKLYENGFHVAGCDASEQGVTHALMNIPNSSFKVLSVYDDMHTEFGNDWDVVISSEVIEHLYDPRTFIYQVSKLLKTNGVFIVTTPYHGWLKNVVLALTGKMDKHFTALWDGGHIKFWSYKTLSKLLNEAEFKVIKFYGSGRLPYLWKSMVLVAIKTA